MGSLIVKLDDTTKKKMQNRHFYSDINMLDFRHSSMNDVPVVYDVEAVKQSVRNILMWRVGESILRPDFGNKLHLSLYQQSNTFNQEKISQEIQRAIEENEPRVEVLSVAAKPEEDDENAMFVKVRYKVVGSKTEDADIVEEAKITGK